MNTWVLGADKTEDSVILAKAEAAKKMAVASGVEYKMLQEVQL